MWASLTYGKIHRDEKMGMKSLCYSTIAIVRPPLLKGSPILIYFD
jgi:hypothetical protein